MNILLTSAGRRTYMIKYFKQALNGKGLVHASNSELTYTLLEADKYVLTPNIYDKNYIPFVRDYCVKNEIDAIISLFDIDLPILAQSKDIFERIGISVVVSNYNVTLLCNDKWATYKFLIQNGIKQPLTFISLTEALRSIKEGIINYPLYIKPRWGMGSIGIYRIDSEVELYAIYKKLRREIFETYLKFESSIDSDSCIIIQETIKGQEYGIEIINDLDANYVGTMAKKKIAMRAGETDVAEIVDPSNFEQISHIISDNLKHISILDVDCFVTAKNEIYVLEMNCRFGGQYPFSHLAGANIPLQIIKWLQGHPTDNMLLTPRIGVVGCKDITPVLVR